MIESFKLPNITPETVSGSIVSFNDEYGGLPLKSCTSLISGYQEGSGVTSPSNVRPLHAFSSANIGNVSNYASWFRGIYQGVYGFVDLGSLNWNYQATYHYMYARLNGGKYTNSSVGLNGLCSLYEVDATNSYSSLPDKCMIVGSDFVTINVCSVVVNDSSYTDANAFKTAMSGVYLIYELATPTTPTITPQEFAILCQAFGITGNIHTFTFGQSIYYGSIDWKRGVVTATMGVRVFDGSSDETWRTYSGQRYTVPVSDFTSPSNSQLANIICDKLETITKAQQGSRTFVISGSDADSHDFMVNVGANSYNDMIDWLNANPITVAYELATPIEIPLGGIQLLTQQGVNNIFCDTGDTTLEWLKVN